MSGQHDVAFLVYGGKEKPGCRKSTSFDWMGNIGAYMVIDCLRRAGITVGFCSPANAHEYKIVLASFTSQFDTFNFIRAVGKLQSWRRRRFRVVAGGFGLINVYPLRHYIDYAVFGRCESFIAEMIKTITAGRDYTHPSVMALEDGIKPVQLGQADELYPHELDTKPIKFRESELGCPRKCLFCNYSFSRRHLTRNTQMFRGALGWGGKEVLFDRLLIDSGMKAMTRTALDGMSERLRFAFHKPISNAKIVEIFNGLSDKWQGEKAWITLYQIGSYPTETEQDRAEWRDVLLQTNCRNVHVYVTVHVTPFRPSALTPAQYLPADVSYNWRRVCSTNIVHLPKLEVHYGVSFDCSYTHLKDLIVGRATEQSDEIIRIICFDRALEKLPAEVRTRALMKRYDCTPYLREYRTTENTPTWYLNSYVPDEQIRSMARQLKADLGMPETEQGDPKNASK